MRDLILINGDEVDIKGYSVYTPARNSKEAIEKRGDIIVHSLKLY
jgi:hypothetical protein